MKQVICIAAILLLSSWVSTSYAQLANGQIVRIKSVSSGKYARPQSTGNQVALADAGNDFLLNWKIIAVPGGNTFRFENVKTGYCLGILDASKQQYGMVQQRPNSRTPDLLWRATRTSKGFKLVNANSGMCMAIEGGGTAVNSKLIQWKDEGQADIVWQFENVGSDNAAATGKKVLFDVVLNYISVSEATRNRIDNGDCRRIFGQVSTELWELDDNNEMKTRLKSYNNMPELIYNQTNYNNPPTEGLSQYQDPLAASANNVLGKVTYNIPEELLKSKKLMLVVKTNIGTRHKDNDFATYDALKMKEETQDTYILDSRKTRTETIQKITDLTASGRNMHLQDFVIPFAVFQRTDDTHKLWAKFSCKIN